MSGLTVAAAGPTCWTQEEAAYRAGVGWRRLQAIEAEDVNLQLRTTCCSRGCTMSGRRAVHTSAGDGMRV
jgi:hypothetical protein